MEIKQHSSPWGVRVTEATRSDNFNKGEVTTASHQQQNVLTIHNTGQGYLEL